MKLTAILLLAVTLTACAAAAEKTLQPGLTGRYYQMTNSLEDFPAIPAGTKPDVERVDKQINFASTLEAFPGTKLVDNNGLHEMQESMGKVELKAGDHVMKVEFFDAGEDAGCILSWKSAKIEKQVVPENVLFH